MSNQVKVVLEKDDMSQAVAIGVEFSDGTRTAVQIQRIEDAQAFIKKMKEFVNRLENISAARFYSST